MLGKASRIPTHHRPVDALEGLIDENREAIKRVGLCGSKSRQRELELLADVVPVISSGRADLCAERCADRLEFRTQ